ncbi:MAG TPA: M20 family metallopeptidase [Candidatus Dormibacteraeota bacterium]|jgi:amidohydrolase|nr:M20 family metallopeptidase [Candidatus Dormibacteraeota bacterium]
MTKDPIASDALAAIDRARDALVALSLEIHRNPELAYREHKAAALLASFLEERDFVVRAPYVGIETSFRADAGRGRPTIAILCEYDALPDIGHACGHNLMAMMGVAAGLGVRAVIDRLDGAVAVIGTPAEEGEGGKIALLEYAGFDDVDAAMIVHAGSRTLAYRRSLASVRVDIDFRGRAVHAASQPDQGINALDGLILTFVGVNALRQQLRPDARIMGVITHGGSAANIIPEYAAGKFSLRALDRAYRDEVIERFSHVAHGAASATGATVNLSVRRNSAYDNMVPNRAMADRYAEHLRGLGVDVAQESPDERMGSTDMGNVMQALPGIHPYIKIAPEGTPGHSVAFRDAAATAEAHVAALAAAKAMALLTIDLLRDRALLHQVKAEFEENRRQGLVRGKAQPAAKI